MADELDVGAKAPDFSLPDQDGSTVTLKGLKGKQVVPLHAGKCAIYAMNSGFTLR